MSDEITVLRRKRGTVKRRLTLLQGFLDGITEDNIEEYDVEDFETRLISLGELKEEFFKIHNEILEVLESDEELNDYENYASEIDEKFTAIKVAFTVALNGIKNPATQMVRATTVSTAVASGSRDDAPTRYLDLLEKFSERSEQASQRNAVVVQKLIENRHAASIKLPTLSLPNFDGDYKEYVKFRDNFKGILEKNNCDDALKLRYLMSVLKKEPLDLISELDKEANGYTMAWETLENRYAKKRVTIDAHLQTIMKMPEVVEKSASSLRALISECNKQMKILNQYGLPVDQWDAMLIFIVKSKLPSQTLEKWNESLGADEMPTLSKLFEFLQARCIVWEDKPGGGLFEKSKVVQKLNRLSLSYASQSSSPSTSKSDSPVKTVAERPKAGPKLKSLKFRRPPCNFCEENHFCFKCPKFLALGIAGRREWANKAKVCFKCLKKGHFADDCSFGGCQLCKEAHNTLLHMNKKIVLITNDDDDSIEKDGGGSSTNLVVNTHVHSSEELILLATARVNVLDRFGKPVAGRVLLDSASQANFMTESFAKALNLPVQGISLDIRGINGTKAESSSAVVATLSSQHNDFSVKLKFCLLPKIAGKIPNKYVDISNWGISTKTNLADPNFNEPNEIDMLIGAELFFRILLNVKSSNDEQMPIFQESQLGCIVAGKYVQDALCFNLNENHLSLFHFGLTEIMTKFWEIEGFHEIEAPSLSIEELACEEHFIENTVRDEKGRFVVRLPLAQPVGLLGNSKNGAFACFLRLEKQLRADLKLYQQYRDFMNEYLRLGHMREVAITNKNDSGYYFPHHAVLRPDSQTTKLRTVFNASFRSSTGISLNDILMIGPIIQDDLVTILMRFRLRQFVFSADVTKMYRQIRVHDDDVHLQRIFWRDSISKPISVYELTTVTYGTAPASYLATKCLNVLADECAELFPLASEAIHDFYMDDCLTGADSLSLLLKKSDQLSSVLATAGFELHKWKSNDAKLLLGKDKNNEIMAIEFNDDQSIKSLGLFWNPKRDYFCYEVSPSTSEVVTKRSILSDIAKLFDPMGLLAPLILRAKIIMRSLWQLKLEWDDCPPENLLSQWHRYRLDLMQVNALKIPRWLQFADQYQFELHGFRDASELAYGACIYMRCIDQNEVVSSKLICAKSKIAPLKVQTIPRLELSAALLLAQLMKKVPKSLKIGNAKIICWSDSTIVLTWIKVDPWRLAPFVKNRVMQINELKLDSEWRHVPTHLNPADIISRGSNADDLNENSLWWNGPEFLISGNMPIQSNKIPDNSEDCLREFKKDEAISFILTSQNVSIFIKYSSTDKLARVMAYMLRFIKNCRKSLKDVKSKILCPAEIDDALLTCVKIVQMQNYCQEFNDLGKDKAIDKSGSLRSLNPFLKDGMIRVGGRLKHANISADRRNPLVLPGNHPFTKAYAREIHNKNGHCGPKLLLSLIRMRFWPTRGGKMVSDITKSCKRCFHVRPRLASQMMGDLPLPRVNESRPFSNVGIDFAGPVQLKTSHLKAAISFKAYVAVFVCFSTKAVHLELVSELSTNAFLACFKRFIARRGLCLNVYSDNGRNFVGANNELSELFEWIDQESNQTKIQSALNPIGVKWNFNAPYAPHRGGLWEAAVKSMKFHLYRIVGNVNLTFEMLATILADIEAILNSRPLTSLSSDPNDLSALTPGHFLIGQELLAIPEVDRSNANTSRLSKWQHLTQMKQHFWARWSSEYLPSLQQRTKWRETKAPVNVGDLVLIHVDHCKPLQWPLARVLDKQCGKDGLPRSVTLKTQNGTTKRVVQKICVLPKS